MRLLAKRPLPRRRRRSATPRRSSAWRRRCEDVESAKARTRCSRGHPTSRHPTTWRSRTRLRHPRIDTGSGRRLRSRRRSSSSVAAAPQLRFSDGGIRRSILGGDHRAAGRPFSKGSPASAASTRRTSPTSTRAATRLAFAMRRSRRAARSPADTRRRFRLLGGLSSDVVGWLVQASDSRSSSFAVHSSAFAKARALLARVREVTLLRLDEAQDALRARALASRRCGVRTRIGRVSAHVSATPRAAPRVVEVVRGRGEARVMSRGDARSTRGDGDATMRGGVVGVARQRR